MRLRMTIALVAFAMIIEGVRAAPCWRTNKALMKLMPCYDAAQSESMEVPAACCSAVSKMTDFGCLCEALLSNAAKFAGINPAIAITIPKRCGISTRPVGYKCGEYTLP